LADVFGVLHPGVVATTLNPAMVRAPRRMDHLPVDPRRPLRPVGARVRLGAPTPAGVSASDRFGLCVRLRWTRWRRAPPPERAGRHFRIRPVRRGGA